METNVAGDQARGNGIGRGSATPPARQVAACVAVLGIPASLASPGATISVALVALYGLWLMLQRRDVPADILRAHWTMSGCYLLILAADLLNGGGAAASIPLAFNYLHLLAIAPYAYAIRVLWPDGAIPRDAVRWTLLGAVAMTAFQVIVLQDPRPGGINLNVIPFAFVIGVWATFLLSHAMERPRASIGDFAIAGLALATILLVESKVAIGTTLLGFVGVVCLWALARGRWRYAFVGLLGAGVAFILVFYFTARIRFASMWDEVLTLAETGMSRGSLGERLELTIAGWRAFLERPALGHGFEERMQVVLDRLREGAPDLSGLGHLHNDYITHLVSFGLAGAVFLAVFLLFMAYVAANLSDPSLRRAGIVLVPMVAVYMSVELAFNMDAVSGLLTMILGYLIAVGRQATLDQATLDDVRRPTPNAATRRTAPQGRERRGR